MIWEKEFVKLVKNEFQKKKSKNPRFSVRQYAKKLDLSIGALSEILNGKRQLTRSRALKVIANLEAEAPDVERMHALMGEDLNGSENSPVEPRADLQEILADWRNFVVISALFHPNANELLPKIASFTNLSEDEVQNRLENFRGKISTESDLINFHLDAFQTNRRIFAGESLKQYQSGQLQLLNRGIEQTSPNDRLFCNITLATSKEVYQKTQRELQNLFLNLLAIDHNQPVEKLYHVSMQMMPLEVIKERN